MKSLTCLYPPSVYILDSDNNLHCSIHYFFAHPLLFSLMHIICFSLLISRSLQNFGHLKDKICTLARRLFLLRFILAKTCRQFFFLFLSFGYSPKIHGALFQLDLRVNHALIKDQFLWVRSKTSCFIIWYTSSDSLYPLFYLLWTCMHLRVWGFRALEYMDFRIWTTLRVILKSLLEPSAKIWALKTLKLE